MKTTRIPPDTPIYPPDTPQTPPDIPQTPPRHLQGTRHANRPQQMPTDTARHTQAAPVNVLGCLAVSVDVCWHVLFPGETLGVSGGCVGGVWRYMSGIHENRRHWDVIGGCLGSQSMQYGAKTLFWHIPKMHDFFSPDHTETLRYQNGRI